MRNLKKEEYDLIVFMLKDIPNTHNMINDLPNRMVEEMNDGGMGSLRFVSDKPIRKFGEAIADIDLSDVDKMPLFISINLDQDGDLFELDVFKGDFSPLKRFPIAPYI